MESITRFVSPKNYGRQTNVTHHIRYKQTQSFQKTRQTMYV